MLDAFNAPTREVGVVRRERTNTPLQALVTLNDPQFVEAARAFALRVLREGGTTDESRIEYAFRLTTGRKPTTDDTADVLELLQSQKAKLGDGWLNPREITTGDPAKLPELPKGVTPTDAAAWVLAARVLLNLDETMTK